MNKVLITLLITTLLLWGCKHEKPAKVIVNGKQINVDDDTGAKGVRIITINGGDIRVNGKKLDLDDDSFIKGSGRFITESRDIKNFDQIQLNFSADVAVSFKDEPSLTITADDNILPAIKTEINDQKLKISCSEKLIHHNKIKIEITVPKISMAEVKGSGNINIVGLNTEKFKSMINGSGDINISGKTNELLSFINGSGDILTKDLLTKSHTAVINGSGKIYTHTSDYLNVNINGSGDLMYKGKPEINSSVQGSGKITKI